MGVSEGFEDNEICTQNCGESCTVNGVFSNNPDADNTDWLLNEGETPTDFTGPSAPMHHFEIEKFHLVNNHKYYNLS